MDRDAPPEASIGPPFDARTGPEDPLPLFVYGTLRPGSSNWSVVAGSVRNHRPAVLPGYRLFVLDHPCVVGVADDPPAGHGGPGSAAVDAGRARPMVRGDLLDLVDGDAALAALDEFEGFDPQDPAGSYYVRMQVVVEVDRRSIDAWVYVAGPRSAGACSADREVRSGDWFDPGAPGVPDLPSAF